MKLAQLTDMTWIMLLISIPIIVSIILWGIRSLLVYTIKYINKWLTQKTNQKVQNIYHHGHG